MTFCAICYKYEWTESHQQENYVISDMWKVAKKLYMYGTVNTVQHTEPMLNYRYVQYSYMF
jgi:hypothetical protein